MRRVLLVGLEVLQVRKVLWIYSEKTAVYKPGKGVSPGTHSASTLVSAFLASTSGRNPRVLVQPPSLGAWLQSPS